MGGQRRIPCQVLHFACSLLSRSLNSSFFPCSHLPLLTNRPLHRAARHGHVGVVKVLLKAHPTGAPAVLSTDNIQIANSMSMEVVNLLLRAAYYNSGNPYTKETCSPPFRPVHVAIAYAANPTIVSRLIVAHPSSIRETNSLGRLPLHVAACTSTVKTSLIRHLLSLYPQAASTRDGNGCLPIHLAMEHNVSYETANLLTKAFTPAVELSRWSKGDDWGGMCPFFIAACCVDDVSVLYLLLREAPDVLSHYRKLCWELD